MKFAYRIAHLSDLHLMVENRDYESCLALVEDAAAQGADHLIISGDLVESGEMKVLRAFVAALKKLGWAGSRRVTIVPGNHDIFPFTKRKFPTIYRRPTSIFNEFNAITRGSRTGKGFRSLQSGAVYPFGKILNEQVVLVGLDTTRNGAFNPFNWAGGELTGEQMLATEQFFSDWRHIPNRIIVMHHPPWKEAFVGGSWFEQNFIRPTPEEVFEWIQISSATLVVCGHVHRSDGIEIKSGGTRQTILRAGTAGGVDEGVGGDKKRTYHLIDLNPKNTVKIHTREFQDRDLWPWGE